MKKYKNFGKKILAVVMAALTVVSTASVDLTAFAAEYGGIGTVSGASISSGGAISQVISCGSNYERMDKASFKIVAAANTSYTFETKVYENLTDISNPESGVLRATKTDTFSNTGEEAEQVIDIDLPATGLDGKPIVLVQGETAAVVVTITSTPGGPIYYFEGGSSENGFRRNGIGSGWESRHCDILDVKTEDGAAEPDDVSLNTIPSKVFMTLGDEDLAVDLTVTPAYKRNVSLVTKAGTSNVSVVNNKIHTAIAGVGGLDVKVGSFTKGEIGAVYVFDNSFPDGLTYVYTGSAIEPNVVVICDRPLVKGADYDVAYTNNTNPGTGKLTIIGKGAYEGYSKSYDFTINKAEITQADVDGGSYTIDPATGNVTAATLRAGALHLGDDFTATTTLVKTTPTYIEYNVNVNGAGNYTTASTITTTTPIKVSASPSTPLDINQVVTAELSQDSFTYTGNDITPSVVFKDKATGDVISDFSNNVNIVYGNNLNATEDATVTITGRSDKNYKGQIDLTFAIKKVSLENSNISIELTGGPFVHTGAQIIPGYTVKYTVGGISKALVEGVDYTVEPGTNKNIGRRNNYMYFTGKGNFKGEVEEEFTIVPDFEKDIEVSIGGRTTTYDEGYASSYKTKYSGSAIKPSVSVELENGTSLNKGTDYDVEFIDNTNAGTAIVRLKGLGAYAGKQVDATFRIEAQELTGGSVFVHQLPHAFNGKGQELAASEVDVRNNRGTILVRDVDYELTYTDNVKAGKATVNAIGKGNYSGTLSGTFTIDPLAIGDPLITIDPIADYTYTGGELRPPVTLRIGGETVSGADYSVEYTNNKNIGTAIVTITGKNNLVGTRTTSFQIKAKSLVGKTFYVAGTPCSGSGDQLASNYEGNYTGGEVKPAVAVFDTNGSALVEGTDYDVTYPSAKDAGSTVYLFVVGKGSYQGSQVRISYKIKQKNISDSNVTVSYLGNEKRGEYTYPKVTVNNTEAVYGARDLVENVDYKIVVGEDAKVAGPGRVAKIQGMGNYTGEVEVVYDVGRNLSGHSSIKLCRPGSLTDVYPKSLDGTYHIPYIGTYHPNAVVTYTDGMGVDLTPGVDYEVTYESLVPEAGGDTYTAKYNNKVRATVTGKGDYYGTVYVDYNIERKAIDTEGDTQINLFDASTDASKTADWTYTYDGKTKSVTPAIKYKPTESITNDLVKGEDFTISLDPATIGPDVYFDSEGKVKKLPVTITAQGNYVGTRVVEYVINQYDLGSASALSGGISISSVPDQAYTGEEIRPSVTVTRKLSDSSTILLKPGIDYDIEYENNIDVTTSVPAKIRIIGKGNYKGINESRTFDIVKRELKPDNTTISPITDVIYDGTAKTPGVSVFYNGKVLKQGVDYTVNYINNKKVGIGNVAAHEGPLVEITGIGSYDGTLTTSFNIRGNISDSSIFTVEGINDEYDLVGGDIVVGDVVVKYKDPDDPSQVITVSSDNYDIVKRGTTLPGNGTVDIVGKNAMYGDSLHAVKVIGNLYNATIVNVGTVYDYIGSAIKPSPTVKYSDKVLTNGIDYTVSYGDNTEVGEGTVTVTAKSGGYFKGEKGASFSIKYNLENAIITGVPESKEYTGSQITVPDISVTCNGKPLSKDVHYTVTYGNNVNVNEGGLVKIEAMGDNTRGSKSATFKITPVWFTGGENVLIDGSPSNTYTYSGGVIQPSITVATESGTPLVLNTDYTVTYSNNQNVGTANVRIAGTGNYKGNINKTFEITPEDIANADFTVKDTGYAGGLPVEPEFSVKFAGRELYKGTANDYTYLVTNNTGVTDSAKITITGHNNFTGTAEKTFKITPTSLSNGKIVVGSNSSVYTGEPITPEIKVLCPTGTKDAQGEEIFYTLNKDTDYTITYNGFTEMVDVGSYSIKVAGNGNFVDSLNTQYSVTAKPVDALDIEYTYDANQEYTGEEITPDIVVRDTTRDLVLTEGVDYDVEYLNNVKSCPADYEDESLRPTIRITGLGNYGGVVDKYFNIGHSMDAVTAALEQVSFVYDGQEHKPKAIAQLGGVTLTEGVDYVVRYEAEDGSSDLKNKGLKKAYIEGTGGYYGGTVIDYEITPKVADASKIMIVPNLPKDESGNYIATYTGNEITPSVVVYDTEIDEVTPLRAGIDYTVGYNHNVNVSTVENPAVIMVHLQGNYDIGADDYAKDFIIQRREIEGNFQVVLVDGTQYWYTGEAVEPEVKVYALTPELVETVLVEGVDYDVTYENNVNAGEAKLVVEGKGNFAGIVERNFNVVGKFSEAVINVEDQFYTGQRVEAPLEVSCGGNNLVKDVDYSVTYYSDDNWETSAHATITPLKPYYSSETVTADYNIVFDPEMLTVVDYANQYTYTGSEIKPNFKVLTPAGTEITYDPSKVKYVNSSTGTDDCTNVGTITAVIPLNVGARTCELTVTYDIIGRNVNICDMIPLIDNTYTGRVLYPPVIIRCNGVLLQEGRDYTLSYKDNINPGVGTITVHGKGNFVGENVLHFNIIAPQMLNLQATPTSDTSIRLNWTNNAHVTGYEIYSSDCSIKYGTTQNTFFDVSGLTQATTYGFKVRTFITVNGKTTYGLFKDVSAHTGISAPKLAITSYARGRATINWNPNANVSGYEIYRSIEPNGTYQKIAVMPATAGGYTDSGLVSNGTYYYKVRAYEKISENEFLYGYFSDSVAVRVK